MTGRINIVVDASPDAAYRIKTLALFDGLVRPGFVNFIGRFTVQPVIGATKAETLRRDDTHMIRRKGLTERADTIHAQWGLRADKWLRVFKPVVA